MVKSSYTLAQWSEKPRTLPERMAWGAVVSGIALGRDINWKGPTKEPFLSMAAAGAVKLEYVMHCVECNVVVHFWSSPKGRSHLKVRTT